MTIFNHSVSKTTSQASICAFTANQKTFTTFRVAKRNFLKVYSSDLARENSRFFSFPLLVSLQEEVMAAHEFNSMTSFLFLFLCIITIDQFQYCCGRVPKATFLSLSVIIGPTKQSVSEDTSPRKNVLMYTSLCNGDPVESNRKVF